MNPYLAPTYKLPHKGHRMGRGSQDHHVVSDADLFRHLSRRYVWSQLPEDKRRKLKSSENSARNILSCPENIFGLMPHCPVCDSKLVRGKVVQELLRETVREHRPQYSEQEDNRLKMLILIPAGERTAWQEQQIGILSHLRDVFLAGVPTVTRSPKSFRISQEFRCLKCRKHSVTMFRVVNSTQDIHRLSK